MLSHWKHIKTITESEDYEINGINIWNYTWKSTGEVIHIKDPLYGQPYQFQIYTIESNATSVEFAAGEFSNGVWGIYQKKK